MTDYIELHCHSNFSLQEGASSVEELLVRAKELSYPALALTDHDNLMGAMRFARKARKLAIKPITGAELTVSLDRSTESTGHLTLLAATPQGYSNLSKLISFAHYFGDRRQPVLKQELLADHSEGLILLSGCSRGPIAQALSKENGRSAETLLRQYIEWFGKDNIYLELQQNLVRGDTKRIRELTALGKSMELPLVATNNVHYHKKHRSHLHDCLVSVGCGKTLQTSHIQRRANTEFYMKTAEQMATIFKELPDAITNTMRVAERCFFNLETDLTYRFPEYEVPEGFDQISYLTHLCYQAARRKYGEISNALEDRIAEEMRRIGMHGIAGLLLIYHEIACMAREVQIDLKHVDPEIPMEEFPPGRGRGSSVAMVVCYLLGLSHIDPMKYNLGLDRFLPADRSISKMPDIDLDFPRDIRTELIKRVHVRYGWEKASLAGAITTYRAKSAIRDLGLALGLPSEQLHRLSMQIENAMPSQISSAMLAMPDFRDKAELPGWSALIQLARDMDEFPRGLSQHPGGMIISSTPLIDQVPVHQSAIEGRYVCHWDKHSIEDAGFIKIDLLAIGALSQMQTAIRLIERRTGTSLDISRVDLEDEAVYAMLQEADTIGIFQVESAAQMQTITRIRPQNIVDMSFEVAAVRPGVGANDGVSEFINRREKQVSNPSFEVTYDHPLEEEPLKRTLGIILFQDQFNELASKVAGFSAKEADEFRRAYLRPHERDDIASYWWPRFLQGALENGLDTRTAGKIFKKFNGQYMFPEAHAYAFGATAYHLAWLKFYYPLEFFVSLFDEQPMGFYNIETLKEDAKRHGISVLGPDVNKSQSSVSIESDCLRLGLRNIQGIGRETSSKIINSRQDRPYVSVEDFMGRCDVPQSLLEKLAYAGALDTVSNLSRRDLRWEIGLRHRPHGSQFVLPLPINHDTPSLPSLTGFEQMLDEYRTMGIHPSSHLMAYLRERLVGVSNSLEILGMPDGTKVEVAGLVVRKQRPLANAYFITLEDEFGHIPTILWPGIYARYRHVIWKPILRVAGKVSRRGGTMNIVVERVEPIDAAPSLNLKSKDWS